MIIRARVDWGENRTVEVEVAVEVTRNREGGWRCAEISESSANPKIFTTGDSPNMAICAFMDVLQDREPW